MAELPEDPMMLMSVINMKLRDFYDSLEALCSDLDVDQKELEKIIDIDEDSICVYQMESLLYTRKEMIGVEVDFSHII